MAKIYVEIHDDDDDDMDTHRPGKSSTSTSDSILSTNGTRQSSLISPLLLLSDFHTFTGYLIYSARDMFVYTIKLVRFPLFSPLEFQPLFV